MRTQTLATCLNRLSRGMLVILAAAAITPARTAEPSGAVLLVATPELGGGYGHTILIAQPVEDGSHVGLILNRPTQVGLADLFPEHAPSRKVAEPVFLGGPFAVDALFALVRTRESPGEGSLQLAPDLFLATAATAVDRVIEAAPERARFYAGLVAWRPGELAAEIERGFWVVAPFDADVALRKRTEGMWEELVRRSRGVTAGLDAGRS